MKTHTVSGPDFRARSYPLYHPTTACEKLMGQCRVIRRIGIGTEALPSWIDEFIAQLMKLIKKYSP
eukprot:2824439-Amphidinium_carterae.1